MSSIMLGKLRLWQKYGFLVFLIKKNVYPEPTQTSKTESFAKIVNDFQPSTIFIKSSILDVWLGSEHDVFRMFFKWIPLIFVFDYF